jgi:diaminopimelate epimerase
MSGKTGQRIHFFKMEGCGNDFILIDNRWNLINADRCRDFVRSVCRHKLSVGADGVILIENDPEVDFKWRFFNADGSEAEMCGNGSRCAARFAYMNGIVEKPQMSFRTLAGIIKAQLHGNGKVRVQMTLPHSLKTDFHLEAAGRSFDLSFINTGVPHAVCFLKDEGELETADIAGWGRALRFHPHFQPAGTNVNFALIRNTHSLAVRTYERGVEAETLACGTGAIASALAAAAMKQAASPVEVQTRSGESLTIYFESRRDQDRKEVTFSEVYMEGHAKIAYEADLWDETLQASP